MEIIDLSFAISNPGFEEKGVSLSLRQVKSQSVLLLAHCSCDRITLVAMLPRPHIADMDISCHASV